jgi:hypothetical protein
VVKTASGSVYFFWANWRCFPTSVSPGDMPLRKKGSQGRSYRQMQAWAGRVFACSSPVRFTFATSPLRQSSWPRSARPPRSSAVAPVIFFFLHPRHRFRWWLNIVRQFISFLVSIVHCTFATGLARTPAFFATALPIWAPAGFRSPFTCFVIAKCNWGFWMCCGSRRAICACFCTIVSFGDGTTLPAMSLQTQGSSNPI